MQISKAFFNLSLTNGGDTNLQYIKSLLKKNPMLFSSLGAEQRKNKELVRVALISCPELYEQLDIQFKIDLDLLDEVGRYKNSLYKYIKFNKLHFNNKAFIHKALRRNPGIWFSFPIEEKSNIYLFKSFLLGSMKKNITWDFEKTVAINACLKKLNLIVAVNTHKMRRINNLSGHFSYFQDSYFVSIKDDVFVVVKEEVDKLELMKAIKNETKTNVTNKKLKKI